MNFSFANRERVYREGGCCTNEISNCCLWWNCSENCNCGGGEECFSAVAAWEGYAMPFYWFGYCPCRCEGDNDVVSAAGGVALSIPDTIFENTDHDVETDVLYTDFGTPKSYDDDVASCRLDASSTGVATYRGTTGFVGEVMTCDGPLEEDLYPVSEETAIPMGSGVATQYPFYLNAGNYSRRYRAARIGFDWTDANGAVAPLHARFTVARPIVEPICTETTNVVESGVEHEYTLNPCAVGVGKDAYFRIRVLPDDYPDENIVWTSDSEGKVSFIGGNTGRAVTVRGLDTGFTNLSIQIGDSPSDPPQFPLHVVTNRVLHMTALVIADESGDVPTAFSAIEQMGTVVNDIYQQIATTILIDCAGVSTNGAAFKMRRYGNALTDDNFGLSSAYGYYTSSTDLSCIFIDSFIDTDSVLAVHTNGFIVMTKAADSLTLAHEIGHSQGASDIYIDDGTVAQVVEHKKFTYSCAPSDWSNGCGEICSGYYTRGIKCGDVIRRMLMNGTGCAGRDMTSGWIFGGVKTTDSSISLGDAPVGFLPLRNLSWR